MGSSASRIEGPEGRDPEFPITSNAKEHSSKCTSIYPDDGTGEVSEEEFKWMEQKRPLKVTLETLTLDYGEEEAKKMQAAFEEKGLSGAMGALNWPGVGTRWQEFLAWCQKQDSSSLTPESAFRGFGQSLGRVVTYRALALDEPALKNILGADCIYPAGQAKAGTETLANIVDEKGVQTVAVARLFIKDLKQMLGHDPSLSLHDDWQTPVVIASQNARYKTADSEETVVAKTVHLFQLSVPKVESMGWTLQEVAERSKAVLNEKRQVKPWFCFAAPGCLKGVWFDGRMQRTERYALYGVPFLTKRLQKLMVFEYPEEIAEALQPFVEKQAILHHNATSMAPCCAKTPKKAAPKDASPAGES